MGEVYAARDTKLGREVPLKVLPPEVATNEERQARFERGARATAALSHPSIVTIYSVERDGESCFLTMELVEGKPLSTRLNGANLDCEEILRLAAALADALATAHEAGITRPAELLREDTPACVRASYGTTNYDGPAVICVSCHLEIGISPDRAWQRV